MGMLRVYSASGLRMGCLMSMECDEAEYAVNREIGIGVSWEGLVGQEGS